MGLYLGQLVWPDYTTYTHIETAFIEVTGKSRWNWSFWRDGGLIGSRQYWGWNDYAGRGCTSYVCDGTRQCYSSPVLRLSQPGRQQP